MNVIKAMWLVFILASASAAVAQSRPTKPAVPPGVPARGFAVAVLLDGLDYTKADVALRLARDGEGVAIAYDAVDDDARPYAATGAIDHVIAHAPTRVVPVRVDAQPETWSRAFAFMRKSPARVVVVLTAAPEGALEREAKTTPDRLLIVPAMAGPKTARANVLTVATLPPAGAPPVTAVAADIVLAPASASREAPMRANGELPLGTPIEAALAASGLFACLDLSTATSPAAVVKLIIARGAKGPTGSAPLVEVCPRQ